MPALDFREARARLQLAEVLDLVGFEASRRRGDQVRGPCPVHRSRTPASRSLASRSLAAHLGKNVWHCFARGAGGNALDLWVAVTQKPLYGAVLDLFLRLGREVPWLLRPRSREKPAMPDP